MNALAALLENAIEAMTPTVALAEAQITEEVTTVVETTSKDVEEDEPKEEDEEAEEEEEEDEDEDDEDDDEPKDQFPILKAECEANHCVPQKTHLEECVERVTNAQKQPGYEDLEYKESCVEEFFHLEHCAVNCAAPKLFTILK